MDSPSSGTLTSPSPSPSPPPPTKRATTTLTRVPKPPKPPVVLARSTAGLDSGSELSELSEDEETEQNAPASAPLEQGEEEEEEDEDEEKQDDMADDVSAGGRRSRAQRKKGSLLPEPMWGWAYKKRTKEGTASNAPSASNLAGGHVKNGIAPATTPAEEEEEEEEPEEEDEEEEELSLQTNGCMFHCSPRPRCINGPH